MAYIRKLPSGNFNAIVRHPSGKRLSKTDARKGVVAAWAAQQEAGFRSGGAATAYRGRDLTFSEWYRRWSEARTVDATTNRKDESRLRNHVLPKWSLWPLRSITRLDVQVWVKDLSAAGLAPSSVQGIYSLLSAALSDAVLEGLLPASPCQRITMPRMTRPEPRWLTRHEYDRLQLALALIPHAPLWQAYVGLGCFSGLRPGELAGLDVSSVDFDRRLVRVTQVLTPFGLRPYPKTDASVRTVPFPAEVADLLWRLLADRSAGSVFVAPRGGRVDMKNFRSRVWLPGLAASGIEPVRPYVMRHTCASWLVQAGVPETDIMAILGHTSREMVRLYAHLAPDRHDRVRAAWGDADSALTHTRPTPTRESLPKLQKTQVRGLPMGQVEAPT